MLPNTKNNIFSVEQVRKDFPILQRSIHSKALVYFDNGATTQKPQQVIDTLTQYYSFQNANIHRGVHSLSQEITTLYEAARVQVQKHLNAAHAHEIIFTQGTTDSINLVAYSYGKKYIKSGDEIMITTMEHHSNIIPWQQVCEDRGAVLKVIPVNAIGELDLEAFEQLLSQKTKIIAVTHVSNTLGTINPIKYIIEKAHQNNIPVLVDGAQATPHLKVDVADLNADFYCFSSHKMYGPTGVGILYGKEKWLEEMPPYQTGGGVIETVSFERTKFASLPLKFEAGTPHIAGGIGTATAIDYLNNLGMDAVARYENELLQYATIQLLAIEGVKIIGTASKKASVISFVVNGLHPYDIGMILDQQGVAVRTGHHCTQPLLEYFKVPGTVRVSFSFYNTKAEIDIFVLALNKALKMLL